MQEKTVQHTDDAQKTGEESQKSLTEQLAEAQARIEQQRESMMRAVADADKARMRAQAEVAAAQKYALERFAENLLPVLDSLEAAVKSADTSGVELTLKQLKGALEKSSVREIDPKPGERFDPYRHQAMAAVPSEAEPNTIVAVMQKGYALHDRVLRPALVSVAKALEKAAENPTSSTDSN